MLLGVLLVAIPIAAPPPVPLRTQGRAFDRLGASLPIGTPIRTFVDGVDYSNGSTVQDGIGSYAVLTAGNSATNAGSDTPTVQEGANLGDAVIYATGDFTTATDVFAETVSWSPAGIVSTDLHLGSIVTTAEPLKIQGIVARPARGGNQFMLVCNPTPDPVSLADYYLERDAPGTYHGSSLSLSGVLVPSALVRVNLTSSWLVPTGDALKLVYRNPGGNGASAGGLDIVVDRVEFNATRGGTLAWEPGNTITGDAPAPTVGRILQRDASCTDTNEPTDFSLGIEPGLPANQAPTVRITVPAPGESVQAASPIDLTWTIADDIFQTVDIHVWANVTIGKQTTALVVDGAGVTSFPWSAPDVAADNIVLRVDVEDPFGAHANDTHTFNLTRQSPIALVVAVLIAGVLLAFLIFGFLRARKNEEMPPPFTPPPMPPAAPMPPLGVATTSPASIAGTKRVCPHCHTSVDAIDVSCFFCGYKFDADTRRSP